MNTEEFFEIFLQELEEHKQLSKHYYKGLINYSSNYTKQCRHKDFINNLKYVKSKIIHKNLRIWDCGCGYGTTALFLAMNGIKTHGSTLEFYYEEIPKRKEYWSKYGDTELFTASYENLFDSPPEPASYDIIILQNTLHHLEPIQQALKILNNSLNKDGMLIIGEENGLNFIKQFRLYLKRGNKKITYLYDEVLKKDILIGNENIRSLNQWQKELTKQDFEIIGDIQYLYPFSPFSCSKFINDKNNRQQNLLLENLFIYTGINFTAKKL